MSLTPQDVQRIAHLARLSLDEARAETVRGQLNGFFDLVEQMNAVDTTGVAPLAHPTAVMEHVTLRQREANQKSAPAVERGLFLVPKVIE